MTGAIRRLTFVWPHSNEDSRAAYVVNPGAARTNMVYGTIKTARGFIA